MSMPPECPDC